MKNVLIFLKSGETITSEMKDYVAERLCEKFYENPTSRIVKRFNDNENELLLIFENISAICVNEVKNSDENKIGFLVETRGMGL